MNILKAIILLFITVTVAILVTKPEMHKPLLAENADFKLTIVTEKPKPAENTLNKHIKTVKQQAEKSETIIIPQKKQTENKKIVEKPKEQIIVQKKEIEKQTQKPEQKTITKKEDKKPVQKKLTPEEEEIIAWNEWRSNLQNKVMRDVVIAAPIGTRFEFSFTVDKFGRISNLKVWSKNPQYTDLAVRTIKPVLQSYQGQSILNFPEKSKRVITNVTGGFSIARTSRYSTPSDYSDYEKIKK